MIPPRADAGQPAPAIIPPASIPPTNADELRRALDRLELGGRRVIVHSSLSSFGRFDGGAEAVAAALRAGFRTTLMPTFSTDSIVPPPAADRPPRNGCDYGDAAYWKLDSRTPYRPATHGIDARMGAIARAFAAGPSVHRSTHPWHSWTAAGEDAAALVAGHGWDRPHAPLERLLDLEPAAQVLFVGVDLRSCTLLHLAEERAGRRPFIRWSRDEAGGVRRLRVAGCAAGFMNLWPACRDLLREAAAGPCRLLAAPAQDLLARATEAIRTDPAITRCTPACLRCRDGARGGPEE